MKLNGGFVAATLMCSVMGFPSLAQAAICDADTDGDVDRADIRLIISARNTPADRPGDPRDPDGNGTITMLDARTCIRQCNLPDCVIINSPPSPSKDGSGQLDAPGATPVQNAVKDASKPVTTTSQKSSTATRENKFAGSTEWKVMRGDTLYAIGRAVYPGDSGKQARLRQDIIKLNPSVFANGANNMAVGTVLKLPDYVAPKSESSRVVEPAAAPAPVPVTVTPAPASQPATSATVTPAPAPEPATSATVTPTPAPQPATSAPVVKPEPEAQAMKEPTVTEEQSAFHPSAAEGNFLLSVGYSYGGEKLVNDDGTYDRAGAGGQFRLGYEHMYENFGGYRVALGLQYGVGSDSGNTSFRDIYLQLAYQYRVDPFAYGIGVVFSEGATFKNDSTTDYDAATGAVVYLENVGSGALSGWGLSYTFLEIDEKDSSESYDASRAEIYYSWRF